MFPPGVGLLSGGVNGLGEDDPQKYFLNFLADFKFGEEPLTPAAAALFQKILQSAQSSRRCASLPRYQPTTCFRRRSRSSRIRV